MLHSFARYALSVLALSLIALPSHATEKGDLAISQARAILNGVKPEDNFYSPSHRLLKTPDDFLSSKYLVHTDCTGFVEEVLRRSVSVTPRFSTRLFPDRYSVRDYVAGVRKGETFDMVPDLRKLEPGDMMVWTFSKPNPHGYNGHIVFIDEPPVLVPTVNRIPASLGYLQWKIKIIDSISGAISRDDTRYVEGLSGKSSFEFYDNMGDEDKKRLLTGVGRGTMYLYTDKDFHLVGVSNGFNQSKFHDLDDWQAIFVRIR